MFRFMNLFHFLAVWFGVIAILSISPVSAFEKPESPVNPRILFMKNTYQTVIFLQR